jgi:hypothetical protein
MSDVSVQAPTIGFGETSRSPRHTVEKTYLNARSWSFQARQRRFQLIRPMIERIIERKGSCRIADIGGTEYYWEIARDFIHQAPVEIHLFNLQPTEVKSRKFASHKGNACDLGQYDDHSFDMVHSNSVIEHVGGWKEACDMAREVRRLAPAYYVQTPNFWFPYEPHFRVPFFQFLPEQVRYRMLMRFNLGFGGRRATVDAAMRGVQSVDLLDMSQMRELFPDAVLKRERIGPLTKSIMALREGAPMSSSGM